MNKINGILMLLIYICVVTALLNGVFVTSGNLSNVVQRTAMYGIIGVGVAFVIITGGIDLSIGSLIALTGCLLAMMLEIRYEPLDQTNYRWLQAERQVVLYESAETQFQAGDRVPVYDGKVTNQGVFRIGEMLPAEVVEALVRESGVSASDAGSLAGFALEKSLAANDSVGRLMRVFSIQRVQPDAQSFDCATLPVPVRPGDRLVYFAEDFERPQQVTVESVRQTEGGIQVALDELPEGFSERGSFGLIQRRAWPVYWGLTAVMGLSLLVGLGHGLLVTKLRLQPFVVTLCGLLIYRGIARTLTKDQNVGFGTEYQDSLVLLAEGKPASVATIMMITGLFVALFSLWRLLSVRRALEASMDATVPRLRAAFGIVVGLVLAVAGSGRFWGGLQRIPDTAERPPLNILGWEVPLWPYEVSEAAASMPGTVMQWLGWLAIPAALVLVGNALYRKPRMIIGPLVALILASVGLMVGVWVRGLPDSAFGILSGWATTCRILTVFAMTGLFFAAIAWFTRIGFRVGGTVGYVAARATGLFAVLALAGRTEIAETLVPAPFLIFGVVAICSAIFLTQTVQGRYLMALGRNEQAARFSGIKTDRMIIMAYIICAGCAGLGGILFSLNVGSVQPAQHGNFYELYAIAAAVLGGCSLRGGEGTILGVVIGAALMQFLKNSIFLVGIPDQLEFAIIGVVILVGVIVDEVVRNMSMRRRALEEAEQSEREEATAGS